MTANRGTGTGSCLIIGSVYVLLYLSGVLLFWMMGSAAHRFTTSYDHLAQARSLFEIHQALDETFPARQTAQ